MVGDRFHGSGMVVSRIVKGNIPVQNGIVHLIDKPLMVVARSLYDYVMQEGSTKSNRLYEFAQLVRDKGGLFGEMLLESKQGTLLAPTNEAFRKLDRRKLDYILGHQKLRNELFGLHFTRERIDSTDKRLLANGELVRVNKLLHNQLFLSRHTPLQHRGQVEECGFSLNRCNRWFSLHFPPH